jgi:small-conductance mechanosensitive channel
MVIRLNHRLWAGSRRAGPFALLVLLIATLAVGVAARAQAGPTSPNLLPAPPLAPARSNDELDRQTPRRTMAGFLKEGKEGDFRVAADYLDLRGVAAATRSREGPDLAQKLAYVLERQPSLDLTKIPDLPEGEPGAKVVGTFLADTLYAGEEPVPIALTRVAFPDGVDRWLIARATVDLIPALDAAYGPRPIGVSIPSSLTRPTLLGNEAWQWIGIVLAIVFAYFIGRGLAALIVRAASYFASRTPNRADDVLVESSRRPLRMAIGALVFRLLLDPLQLTTSVLDVAEHAIYTVLVVAVTWLALRVLRVATLWLDEQAMREGSDVMHARSVRTQAILLRRVASVTTGFVAGAFLLLQFDFVRSVGVSLLASAGVMSVVVGFAAQKSLAAIIGGIQFSVAQPVRIGDQVVLEGEFGEIEEINLTYVVVRIWDKRRLILPITYFLEKPFQHWTRSATDLVGSVLLRVDYAIPVDAVRMELTRICEADALWDRRTCSLQVTDSDASSATLRALVSAENASKLWDLRCNVRERLLAFVHAYENGRYLAHTRHEVQASA